MIAIGKTQNGAKASGMIRPAMSAISNFKNKTSDFFNIFRGL
jgi:hypothetical protein